MHHIPWHEVSEFMIQQLFHNYWSWALEGRSIDVRVPNAHQLIITEKKRKLKISISECNHSESVDTDDTEGGTGGICGLRGNIAVAEILWSDNTPEFYVLDLANGKCLGKFRGEKNCFHACFISPDASRIVLLPTDPRRCQVKKQPSVHHIQDKTIYFLYFPQNINGYSTCFDNRHPHCFLFHLQCNQLATYDLDCLEDIPSCSITVPRNISQLRTSPSGWLLLALRYCLPSEKQLSSKQFGHVVVHSKADINVIELTLFLDHQCPFPCQYHMACRQLFPHFSNCERTLSILQHTDTGHEVLVYKLPAMLFPLRHLCRQAIRTIVDQNGVTHLPLPKALLEYLVYKRNG
jgi:hypothetical protein